MEKTNAGLAAHCGMALAQGWYYLWGAYGNIATQAYLDANIKQYPENAAWRSYASKAIGKTRFCDCYGLVKSYLWWAGDAANPKYNAAQDISSAAAHNRAAEKGPLATLPETPGVILWMAGHVGVYMGGGKFAECESGVGMSEGSLSGDAVVKGSRFTNWFKDANISYADNAALGRDLAILKQSGIIADADYWLGNYYKLEYTDLLIANMAQFVQKAPPVRIGLPEALKTLAENGVIRSPDYWLNNYDKLDRIEELISGMAVFCRERSPAGQN